MKRTRPITTPGRIALALGVGTLVLCLLQIPVCYYLLPLTNLPPASLAFGLAINILPLTILIMAVLIIPSWLIAHTRLVHVWVAAALPGLIVAALAYIVTSRAVTPKLGAYFTYGLPLSMGLITTLTLLAVWTVAYPKSFQPPPAASHF